MIVSGDTEDRGIRGLRLAITGPKGFLAWHTRVAWLVRGGRDMVQIGRAEFNDPALMDKCLAQVDAVIHLAGVNRASEYEVISTVNPWLAAQLVGGLERLGSRVPVVYGNSVHASEDSVFGESKRRAGDLLASWGQRVGAPFSDVLLPNIFGEHGLPFYNSVVATFSHQLVSGQTPRVQVDRELPLLHAQEAASALLDAAVTGATGRVNPSGVPLTVSELLERLTLLNQGYKTGEVPDVSDPFTRDLFNTFRSYTFPEHWPLPKEVHADERGGLVDVVRARGGEAQIFQSRTSPGATRGNHFHLRKLERFHVLQGQAIIRLRRLFTDSVVEFVVSGEQPVILDMPTMWTHSITNTGDNELLTLFYADELLDQSAPDTYPTPVVGP